MEPIEVGNRIGIILKLDNRKRNCFFLGYGIYEGKFIPPENVPSKKGKTLYREHKECCKLLCDDGNTYWDFECWFMTEEMFKEVFVNDCYNECWDIINIDIKGRRRSI